MNQRIFTFTALVFLMWAGTLQAQTELVVPGTGDSQAILRILAKDFNSSNPEYNVVIPDSIGSGGGVKAVGKDKNEMGRVARPIKDKEKKYGLEYKVFASSPVVFAVNGDVGVSGLSASQIVSIYDGSVGNWKEVGGKDLPIYIVNREAGDSSRSIIEKNIPGFKDIARYAGKVIYSTPETVDTIVRYENTMGYVPLSTVIGKDVKILSYENNNFQDENYPLITPLGLIWKNGKLSEGMAKFKDFLFSNEARRIISDFGAVPARN